MEKEEIKKLVRSATSTGLKRVDPPNLLKDLLKEFTEINRVDLYLMYCYYSAGYSLRKIKRFFRARYTVEQLNKIISENFGQ